MSQLQFQGGCLTRRPKILVTSQSPAEIVLRVIFGIMIHSNWRISSVCLPRALITALKTVPSIQFGTNLLGTLLL